MMDLINNFFTDFANFIWGDFAIYLTARKKIIGIGIPLLAKAKLFYGG